MHGRGLILRVDLNCGTVVKEEIPRELCLKYLGGEGVNSWLLWEHFLKVDPKTDPLDSDNVLIAGLGPLGGTGYGAGSKMKWTYKSPLSNMFGDSVCGGGFASALRLAGYDHLVITGKAKAPVYIWIDDESVEIRNASHLWGKDTNEVDLRIKQELGDERIEVATIGRAAENLVAFASIIVSGGRVAGRTGAGCVMASKNLKAISVRGTKGIRVHDPLRFQEAKDELIAAMNASPENLDTRRAYGTLTAVIGYQIRAGNAYRNCQYSVMPDDKAKMLSHKWYLEHLAAGSLTCSPGCIMGCSGWFKIKGNEPSLAAKTYKGVTGIKAEYLAVASLGIMPDLPDMAAVLALVGLCSKYGMDAVEVGACCALLMELWQRGFLTEDDTISWTGEPLSLEWGNLKAIEKIVHSIALQDDQLGRLLRGGVYKAACNIQDMKEDVPALRFAIYGKGGSPFGEDVRGMPSRSTNMAVASRGADHLKGFGTLDLYCRPDISNLYFGTPDAAKAMDITLKGATSAMAETRTAIISSLGLCVIPVGIDPIQFPLVMFSKALSALTGDEIAPEEMFQIGERVVNLEKAFNSRVGYRRKDDRLCDRWLKDPKPSGPDQGWKAEDFIEQTKDDYYERRGWDKVTSLQTRQKLRELNMTDVAKVLRKEGALI
ncbi:aldehyde ferredoxin oxidoreductase family protein [Chloroflexota bacterium]